MTERRVLKVKEVIRILKNDGWQVTRISGSHRQLKHKLKPGLVTVAGQLSDDLAIGTLKSIWKQAQITPGRTR